VFIHGTLFTGAWFRKASVLRSGKTDESSNVDLNAPFTARAIHGHTHSQASVHRRVVSQGVCAALGENRRVQQRRP